MTPCNGDNKWYRDSELCLSKASGLNEVLSCIQALSKGETHIDPTISVLIDKSRGFDKSPFNAREMDMLYHFNEGLSIHGTTKKAYLSKHTVVTRQRKMMEKSNCKSITELLAYARKLKII